MAKTSPRVVVQTEFRYRCGHSHTMHSLREDVRELILQFAKLDCPKCRRGKDV
jgi:hypothetical protein